MQNKVKLTLIVLIVSSLNGLGFYWMANRSDRSESIDDKSDPKQENFIEGGDDREVPENFPQERDVVVDTNELKERLRILLGKRDWRVVETYSGKGLEGSEEDGTFILHDGKVVRYDHEGQSNIVKGDMYYLVARGRDLWSGNRDDFLPESLY